MLLETSGDLEEFPQQPVIDPIKGSASAAMKNLVVFILFLQLAAVPVQGNEQLRAHRQPDLRFARLHRSR
jgi:hypothetical protein